MQRHLKPRSKILQGISALVSVTCLLATVGFASLLPTAGKLYSLPGGFEPAWRWILTHANSWVGIVTTIASFLVARLIAVLLQNRSKYSRGKSRMKGMGKVRVRGRRRKKAHLWKDVLKDVLLWLPLPLLGLALVSQGLGFFVADTLALWVYQFTSVALVVSAVKAALQAPFGGATHIFSRLFIYKDADRKKLIGRSQQGQAKWYRKLANQTSFWFRLLMIVAVTIYAGISLLILSGFASGPHPSQLAQVIVGFFLVLLALTSSMVTDGLSTWVVWNHNVGRPKSKEERELRRRAQLISMVAAPFGSLAPLAGSLALWLWGTGLPIQQGQALYILFTGLGGAVLGQGPTVVTALSLRTKGKPKAADNAKTRRYRVRCGMYPCEEATVGRPARPV